MSQQSRPSEELDEAKLLRWLVDHDLTNASDIHIQQFAGGASNWTYAIQANDTELVLRRPPAGVKAKSAHDMGREVRVLTALQPHFPYGPTPLGFCEDKSVLGEPFYVMTHLQGEIWGKDLPEPLSATQADAVCKALMDVHIELHRVPLRDPAIAALGRPEGYVERQVRGWSKRYRAAKTPGAHDADKLMGWLAQRTDPLGAPSVIHNDYKLDNVVFSRDKAGQRAITGVLDWEMATLGDPWLDLGCSLAYWIEAGDVQALQALRMMPTHLPGMWTRDQLMAYYRDQRAQDQGSQGQAPDLNFAYVFGLFRLATIVQQIYLRVHLGQSHNPRFKSFGAMAHALCTQATRVIERST